MTNSRPDTDLWRSAVPSAEWELYRAAGYGARTPFGPNLGLLIVDTTYSFTGYTRAPTFESVHEHPNSCGRPAWDAVDALTMLLEQTRQHRYPILYTKDISGTMPPASNVWHHKRGYLDKHDDDPSRSDFVSEIAPQAHDDVVLKRKPSAFFDTDLADVLRRRGVDNLLITGGTTSGCVRASVIDAFSHGFRVGVVADCVFDRGPTSHAVNLFDIDQKYGDVLSLDEAVRILSKPQPNTLPSGGKQTEQRSAP